MGEYHRALITGASAGIGESFAEELASRGCSLVLVARRRALLEAAAERLRERHRVEAEVLVADLADPRQLEAVENRLSDESSPVDLLVNNAGVGETEPFADCPVDSEQRTVLVNALAPTRLCHAALASMTKRGRGGILNVASMAGQLPAFRNSATYGATKSYLCSLSESIRLELKAGNSRIAVTAVCPGYVPTDLTAGITLPKIAWTSREKVVRDSLRGLSKNKPLVIPGTLYKLAAIGARAMPRALVRPFAADSPKDDDALSTARTR
ncbi:MULTISPECIES: SDR family NAD(P)-dependent oxidoreductase [Amycolatopsis]|uniref:SDR family oxidoreductase n=1 Tax=Amycolatopsis dendrobii TaxID=2760662 RepID=A0A7W3ZCC2_9PSEU|nr:MULTISPECIES: SDR family oxidoreductase [Amycolatopsis]MBB1156135.1 SDR family oxidoreductase [Amycolatopsis dendrobii]UKD58662.1 SDR family oxidoreductase [Amycolatopsis sp. FU40]